MKIKINDIESFRAPESFQMNFDDRQQRVEIFGGAVIQDLGAGENTFSVTAMFREEDFVKLVDLWNSRAVVTFTDENEQEWGNCRLSLKSCKYVSHFSKYVTATFEIWQITEGN